MRPSRIAQRRPDAAQPNVLVLMGRLHVRPHAQFIGEMSLSRKNHLIYFWEPDPLVARSAVAPPLAPSICPRSQRCQVPRHAMSVPQSTLTYPCAPRLPTIGTQLMLALPRLALGRWNYMRVNFPPYTPMCDSTQARSPQYCMMPRPSRLHPVCMRACARAT